MKRKKIAKRILQIILVYVLICVLLPPLLPIRVSSCSKEKDTDDADISFPKNTTNSNTDADTSNEKILCIDDNTDALKWRLHVIESAKEEIILSSFDFRADNSGKDILSALQSAADRGVKIRILVDGFTFAMRTGYSRYFSALASSPTVEIKLYNPIRITSLFRINYCLHDKYLIADDTVYILGGRNTNDLFLGDYITHQNVDRDILVWSKNDSESRSITDLRAYFEEIWDLDICKNYPCKNHSAYETELTWLKEHYLLLQETYPDAFEEINWEEATTSVNSITLLTGPTQAWNKEPELFEDICAIMAGGENVLIQTPYIVCDRRMYKELTALIKGAQTSALSPTPSRWKTIIPGGCWIWKTSAGGFKRPAWCSMNTKVRA